MLSEGHEEGPGPLETHPLHSLFQPGNMKLPTSPSACGSMSTVALEVAAIGVVLTQWELGLQLERQEEVREREGREEAWEF